MASALTPALSQGEREEDTEARYMTGPLAALGGALWGRFFGAEQRRAAGGARKRASTTSLPQLSERRERSEQSEFCGTPALPSSTGKSGQRPDRQSSAPTAPRPAQPEASERKKSAAILNPSGERRQANSNRPPKAQAARLNAQVPGTDKTPRGNPGVPHWREARPERVHRRSKPQSLCNGPGESLR